MTQFPKPTEVKAMAPFCIYLRYADGLCGELDLGHLQTLKPFQVWNETGKFEQVRIADNGRCIAWNDDLELCPNALYLELTGKQYEEYATH